MTYHATERHAYGTMDPRAVMATRYERNPYLELARAIALVTTPYAACTDLDHKGNPYDY